MTFVSQLRAIDVYPETEAEFEAQGGICIFCENTEFGEHSSECPVSEDDFAEED
jgi:hypothetical protein